MNTLIALLLISPNGAIEEKYRFNSIDECNQAQEIIEEKTMCVQVNVRKPSEDIKDFFNQFNETVRQFKEKNDNQERI